MKKKKPLVIDLTVSSDEEDNDDEGEEVDVEAQEVEGIVEKQTEVYHNLLGCVN